MLNHTTYTIFKIIQSNYDFFNTRPQINRNLI
nr:MAG TPA: hypothetical protein [Caudoviricetes sp.]DAQ59508.1 MAG TPA: hypothetical protein [Caudoviricetes sp.]DAT60815.1 MAG TPA: hypothetical protein [Bacteriophage sp.]